MSVVPLTISLMGRLLITQLKQLLLLVAILFISACSRYKAQSSAQIIVSGLTSNQSNDLILNGMSEDGEYFTTHLKANQTPSPIEIPVGKWSFYGFYWEDRTAYCTWNSSELLAATEKVDLTFSKENCFHEKFAHPTYRKNNSSTSRLPLVVMPCSKYTIAKKDVVINSHETFEQHCDLDVDYESLRVTYPSVNLSSVDSPDLNYSSIVSECIDVSQEGAAQKVFAPVGSNIPFFQDFEFFSDTECTNKFGSVKINRLLNDSNKGRYFIIADEELGLSNVITLFLDEVDESAINQGEEEEQEGISLSNDQSVTFDRKPKFTITGTNPLDTVYLFTSEDNCKNQKNIIDQDIALEESIDITLSKAFGLGLHEIFAKIETSEGDQSECIMGTYTISDPDIICNNRKLDEGYETSMDCGGLCANEEGSYQCGFGLTCYENEDCATGLCDTETNVCTNYSLSFNGTSNYVYFSGTDSPNVDGAYSQEPNINTDLSSDYTISMWIKSNDLTNRQVLLGQRDNSDYIWDGQFNIELHSDADSDIRAWHYQWPVNSAIEHTLKYKDASLEQSRWYHIVYTIKDLDSAPVQKLFVNGEKVSSRSLLSNQIAITNQLKIYLGAEVRHILLECCDKKYFDGEMDDVAIWKTALDEDAVNSIYNSGTPFDLRLPNENYLDLHINELHAYYRFNSGEGSEVLDSSSNEYNGIINDGNNSNWHSSVNILDNIGTTPLSLGAAPGVACTMNDQCSSHSCLELVCQQSTLFAYCQSDQDCAEGTCDNVSNICLGSPGGAQCSNNSDCFSGSCTLGTCDPSTYQSPCDPDNIQTECSAGLTCQLTQSNEVANHSGTYSYNVYQCLKSPHFAFCSSNNDCESGICLNNFCFGKTTGDTCNSDAECFSKDCADDNADEIFNCKASEDICSSDHDCNGKTCVDNSCMDVGAFVCWNNSFDEEVETDFNCGGTCVNLLGKFQCQAGQMCNYDRDCASGTCLEGECIDNSLYITNSYIYFDFDVLGNPVAPEPLVTESNSPAIDDSTGDNSWSINVWIKTSSVTWQTIVSQAENTDDKSQKAFSLKMFNNELYFKYFHPTYHIGSTYFSCTPAVTLSNNEWHMVTITKKKESGTPDKGIFNLFVDGNNCMADQEIVENAGAVSNLNKIYIGKDVAYNHGQFVGLLDNLTFWSTDLAATEVEELYNHGKALNPLNNFHDYKSSYYVTNNYNMNINDDDSPEAIEDSAYYSSDHGRAYYSGVNTTENKLNYFEYSELTPGGRTIEIGIKGLCRTKFDDIINDFQIDTGSMFSDLSIQYVNGLDVPDQNSFNPWENLTTAEMEIHFSDHETESATLILGEYDPMNSNNNFHYYPIKFINEYYEDEMNYILVNSDSTGVNGMGCNLRNAIRTWNNSWNNASGETSYGDNCLTLTSQSNPTAIIFDSNNSTKTYSLAQSQDETDDDDNTLGDLDITCSTGGDGCAALHILGCGNGSDTNNYTKIMTPSIDRNSRILDVKENVNLVMANLILYNGKALDGLGGAIKNAGDLTIDAISFKENTAQGPDGEGFESGVTEFYGGGGGGASGMGGAIFNDGTLNIFEEVSFTENEAIGGNGGAGGEQECLTAFVCIAPSDGVGGAGATLSTNDAYWDLIDQGGEGMLWEEIIGPTKENFLINSGGHGGYSHADLGNEGTTGSLGGGTGGGGLVDGGLSGTSLLFRAGGGGATHWDGLTGHSGGGGGGGAFGAAIFNNASGTVNFIEANPPTFTDNILTAGSAGNLAEIWGGSNPSMMGIGSLASPENLFNYGGDVNYQDNTGSLLEFDFNPTGAGNDLKFYDYHCGESHPDTCICTNGECNVPGP